MWPKRSLHTNRRLRLEGRTALHTEKEQWLSVHKLLAKLWKTEPRLT